MPSTRKSVGHTEQENQVSYVPPRLTPRTNHIPPSVPSAYLNTPVVPQAQPPPVIDPQLLAGDSEEQIGLHMVSVSAQLGNHETNVCHAGKFSQ